MKVCVCVYEDDNDSHLNIVTIHLVTKSAWAAAV